MVKDAKEGGLTKYIVFEQKSIGFIRTWDNISGIGGEIDFGGFGELWEIKLTFIQRYAGENGLMSKPLLAKVVERDEADFVIWKGDVDSESFRIWRIDEPSAPVDKKDAIFVRSLEVDVEIKFDIEDHKAGHAKI